MKLPKKMRRISALIAIGFRSGRSRVVILMDMAGRTMFAFCIFRA